MRRTYTVRSDSLEDPSVPLSAANISNFLHGTTDDAGVAVTARTALGYAPLYQAVSMISGDEAKLPKGVYQRTDRGRKLYDKHMVHKRINLYGMANPQVSAYKFWRRMDLSALLWGNGYAYIDRDGAGRVLGLYNLLPDRTTPYRRNGELWYMTEVGGKMEAIPDYHIYHIEGLCLDGLAGANMVRLFREDFGIALARRRFTAKFFKNNMTAGGILGAPPSAKPDAIRKVQKQMNEKFSGVNNDNAFKTVVLRDGYKWFSTQVDPEKAQLQEMDEQQARNVARMFNLHPSRLGVVGSTSYNSQEMAKQDYHDGALSHWLISHKSECNTKLLSEDERDNQDLYIDYNINALLWTDAKTRSEIANTGIQNGRFNQNETRAWENLDAYDGGDTYYRPLNLEPVGQAKFNERSNALRKLVESTFARAGNRLSIRTERKRLEADQIKEERSALMEIVEPALAVTGCDAVAVANEWCSAIEAEYRAGKSIQDSISSATSAAMGRVFV